MATTDTERPTASRETWLRGLFMLLLIIFFSLGQMLMNAIAVLQFLWLLFTGRNNAELSRFGASLAEWFAATGRFLSCASEEKPFPWREWPRAPEPPANP